MSTFSKRRRLVIRAEKKAFKKYLKIISSNEKAIEGLILDVKTSYDTALSDFKKVSSSIISDIKREFNEALVDLKNTNNLIQIQQKVEFDRIEKSRQKEVDEKIKTLNKKIETLNNVEQIKFKEVEKLAAKNARFTVLVEGIEEKHYSLRKELAVVQDAKKQRDALLENGSILNDTEKELFIEESREDD